jgi:hypothetical protein
MRWPLVLLSLLLWSALAPAQSVISVRSGLINYSEGAVFIDNQLVKQKLGKYPSLHEGSDLLTQDGRAEIQFAPEVFLRVGINSGVRMISSDLADTKIQLLSGSVILDSGNAASNTVVTLLACEARIRIENPSRLRVDFDPPQLRVEKGEATVERDGHVTKVAADQLLGLNGAPVVRRMTDGNDDALDLWSQQRNRLIYLSLAGSRNIMDPGTADPATMSDADLNAWLGYIPSAGVLPLAGSYGAVGMPGYGYYSPWSTLAFYGPLYGGYQMGFAGLGMGYPGLGYPERVGAYGVSFGYRGGYSTVPGYRFTPVYPGSVGMYGQRPAGGVRIGVPGPGISFPARPVMPARPVAPHLPAIHR